MTIQLARKIAVALDIKSESRIRAIDKALLEYVRLTQQSPATPSPGAPAAHTHAAEADILGAGLGNYADDAAAAVGGVEVGGLYRNGSVVQVRVS